MSYADRQKLELELFEYLNSPDMDQARLLRAIQRCRQKPAERRQKSASPKGHGDRRASCIDSIKLIADGLCLLMSRSDSYWGAGVEESRTTKANEQLQVLANSLPMFVMLLKREAQHG